MQEAGFTALDRFMEANGRRDQWLADQIGSSQPTANRIRRGAQRPSPDKAFKIEQITEGVVKAAALLTGPLAAELRDEPGSHSPAPAVDDPPNLNRNEGAGAGKIESNIPRTERAEA